MARSMYVADSKMLYLLLTLFFLVLADAWENCQDTEVLLESPYAMAGVHISEALSKFRAFSSQFFS